MSDALPLPPRPNLEQYKKLAKNLTARNSIAREHGFTSWLVFAKHVQALGRASSPVSKFEAAVEAIINGDAKTLRKLLRDRPGLARERSAREHRSTLLHYVSANGVEDFRQKTPKNIVKIAKMLLNAGADVNAESDAYGGGSMALDLTATSIHPERADVQIALLQTLLDRGARFNRQSIVSACIANGQPKAAEFFVNLGASMDLEGAAALGRLDVVKGWMESALRYASGYGRKEVVEWLLEKGVDPGAHNPGRRTGLHWAAYGAHVEVVKLLLEHGAPVDLKEDDFHATPLDMALYVWNNYPDRAERCYEMIALLARAGAKLDPQHWPERMSERIRSDPRMLAALGDAYRAS